MQEWMAIELHGTISPQDDNGFDGKTLGKSVGRFARHQNTTYQVQFAGETVTTCT